MEGRGDNVRGLNLGRSLDKSCQRLKHFRIGIGVVSFGIGFAFPQADCSYINPAGTSKCDFVLETILFTKQKKDVLLKSSGVIGKQGDGFQKHRSIECSARTSARPLHGSREKLPTSRLLFGFGEFSLFRRKSNPNV